MFPSDSDTSQSKSVSSLVQFNHIYSPCFAQIQTLHSCFCLNPNQVQSLTKPDSVKNPKHLSLMTDSQKEKNNLKRNSSFILTHTLIHFHTNHHYI